MFFGKYRKLLVNGVFVPTCIWNRDETGFSTVAKSSKVVSTKGINQVRKVSSAERGKNITALRCMSAAGTLIPPLFVFPRKRMVDSLMNGAPASSVGTVNTRGSGYIDNNLFLRWCTSVLTLLAANDDTTSTAARWPRKPQDTRCHSLRSRECRRDANIPASLHPSTTTPRSDILPIPEDSVLTCGRQLDDLQQAPTSHAV